MFLNSPVWQCPWGWRFREDFPAARVFPPENFFKVIPEKETLELDYVTNQRPDCHGAVAGMHFSKLHPSRIYRTLYAGFAHMINLSDIPYACRGCQIRNENSTGNQ